MNIMPKAAFMRLIKSIAFLSFLLTFQLSQGQVNPDHPYQFKVNGVADTVAYLANYYGEKLYYADTARVNNLGEFSFKAIPEENQGKYAVVVPGPKYFEVIIADGESIKMHSDTVSITQNVKVLESENNKIMYDYMAFLIERRAERQLLVEQLEANEGKPDRTAALKTEYNNLNDMVEAYQRKVAEVNPDKFAAKEILMSVENQPPTEMQEDKLASYYYFKNHYFDNIDLKDDRIVRTPIFQGRLTKYINTTLIQNPDTLIVEIDKLVDRLEPGSELFKYIVHYTTYNFETSKIMGMDKVFVHMVDNYYSGDQPYWMSEENLEKIREKADTKRNVLIGMKAPELKLCDTLGNWISTYTDIKTKYVVLYFYNPDCGHCKKETPKLVDFYNESDKDLVSIYAVSSDNSEKWNEFIREYGLEFYNVSIPQEAYSDRDYATNLIRTGKSTYHSLKFTESFDVYSTPKVFILDEDRIIKAKDIGVEQVKEIIDRLEGIESEEATDTPAVSEEN